MENQEIRKTSIPEASLRVLPKDTSEAIAKAPMDQIPVLVELLAKSTPNKVEELLDAPHLRELVRKVGDQKIKMSLEIEIAKLASRMNVANNVTAAQLPFIAEELLNTYPEESLQDFILCFRRIALGYYGKMYHQLDLSVISQCMQQHIEEKAMYLERGHIEQKKESDYPQVDYNAYKKRIDEAIVHERNEKVKAFVAGAEYLEAKNAYKQPSKNEVLKKYWHGEWVKANFHPISGKKLESFLPENEWLESKGYFIDGNGEVKEI